ncbi:hypothetical protein F5B22DRAFT_476410 [Xylaria bambusicola]|uniref:uncharacterized protein n=1 Tax=Xylaria bambusicola TaxID=326684 RepID=UPI0020086DBF|nr:uncharacterized protein F5B22DRAFT_476410 [Xylaria bambusicola]KAI0506186.1 hypothetical protein F5B22DRAFT_476410 [Xylaria bambusicola]
MGNLKDKIKATLLRRDSRRQSPSPSKNSFGRDYASSVSTHTQPGYDASDERSDHGARGSSRSFSLTLNPDQVLRRSTSKTRSKSGNLHDKPPHTSTPDANVSVAPIEKSRNKSKTSQAHSQGQDQRTDDANVGDTSELNTGNNTASNTNNNNDGRTKRADGSNGSSLSRGGNGAAAHAPVKTSAKSAPPLLQAGPAPAAAARNSKKAAATAGLGKDRQNPALNPRSAGSSTNPTAPASIASDTTNDAAISTAAGSVTAGTGTGPVPVAAATGLALPSIHEHPATPPTNPASEITSPDPRAAFNTVEYDRDDIATPLDDPLQSASILTPLATSLPRPSLSPLSFARPFGPLRRQSILPPHQTDFARALLHGYASDLELDPADLDQQHLFSGMVTAKIWVKRPLASATLITIGEDDLVDDVREQILRKYANSLGRQFDAPDLTLKICNREQQTTRILQPDEVMTKVIESYYPKGQTVDDALLIDIPSRRTPKASPNPRFYADDRPHESGTDYFPPYPPPHHAVTMSGQHGLHFPPSMSIVGGNGLPPLPSPGSARRLPINRPNLQRMHTASPVSIANSHTPQVGAASTDQSNHQPAAAPIPTPPPVERTATPPPRTSSPMPSVRTKKKRIIDAPSLPSGLLDTAVPPINILIVEDNMINLRLLEAFVKRLKVRWQTAVNGREAVDKWRAGGFHLVLMDIQLPIMNGLEATREIRRVEKANSIGVFSSSASSPPDEILPEPAEEDKLANTEMFKSPVIIVALTASSLQSDRHEALAAGCNDFLTKPVNFDWLQRKVKEWGCMQALIDFDGWRKWKDYSQKTQDEAAKKTAATTKAKPVKKNRLSMTAAA